MEVPENYYEFEMEMMRDQIEDCLFGPFSPSVINKIRKIRSDLLANNKISEADRQFLNQTEAKLEEDA